MNVRVLALLTGFVVLAPAEDAVSSTEVIVDHYSAAYRDQSRILKGATMEVEIDASVPKLKKHGKLHALRHITALGRLTYEMLRFDGDGAIKRDVINNYLKAELENQDNPKMALTPDNYKFKYKGRGEVAGRAVHLFEVTPRQKREGLFKGNVWIDAETYLRVQESGHLVKNPSFIVKSVDFVRKYEVRDGISVPVQTQSVTETRLFGRVEMTIDYSNFSIDPATRVAAAGGENQ